MEVTKGCTLENWRTREIEIYQIHDTIFSLSFEDLLKKVFMDGRLDQNPIEVLCY